MASHCSNLSKKQYSSHRGRWSYQVIAMLPFWSKLTSYIAWLQHRMAICAIASITVTTATLVLKLKNIMKHTSSSGPYLSSRKVSNSGLCAERDIFQVSNTFINMAVHKYACFLQCMFIIIATNQNNQNIRIFSRLTSKVQHSQKICWNHNMANSSPTSNNR